MQINMAFLPSLKKMKNKSWKLPVLWTVMNVKPLSLRLETQRAKQTQKYCKTSMKLQSLFQKRQKKNLTAGVNGKPPIPALKTLTRVPVQDSLPVPYGIIQPDDHHWQGTAQGVSSALHLQFLSWLCHKLFPPRNGHHLQYNFAAQVLIVPDTFRTNSW
jgi:hypothetical protein